MFNSSKYINKILSHLEDNVSDLPNHIDVVTKFPAQYISYPMVYSTIVVSIKKIDFITVSSDPAGSVEVLISIYTARDRGFYAHQNLLDQTITALLDFEDYDFFNLTVGDSYFNRTSSAICTEIVGTINFGEQPV